jgi:hypothetical protein
MGIIIWGVARAIKISIIPKRLAALSLREAHYVAAPTAPSLTRGSLRSRDYVAIKVLPLRGYYLCGFAAASRIEQHVCSMLSLCIED